MDMEFVCDHYNYSYGENEYDTGIDLHCEMCLYLLFL
jgi:hypothetical protein